MEDLDPDLTKNLAWLLDNKVDGLDLTFTYETYYFDEKITKELIPGGRDIVVTEENKHEFVMRLCETKMINEIKPQIQAFLKGFRSVIPRAKLEQFSPSELEIMISGPQQIDINDMKANTIYSEISNDHQLIVWFWEILEEFSQEELSSFLFFLTGNLWNFFSLSYRISQSPH